MAKAVSTDPSKATGGDLGWIDSTADRGSRLAGGRLQARCQRRDRRHPRRRRHVPDRARHRDRPGRRSTRPGTRSSPTPKISQAAYRAAIQSEVDPRRRSATRSSPTPAPSGPAEAGPGALHPGARQRPPATERDQGPPHPVLAEGRPVRARRALPTTDPTLDGGPAQRPRRPTTRSRPTRSSSTSSPARRATRPRPAATTGPAASCRTSIDDERARLDPAFADGDPQADGLQPGDLLAPFKSAFGWHVVQVMYRPPDIDEMAKLKTQAEGGTRLRPARPRLLGGPEGRHRRRHRLGRQRPARRPPDGGDPRDARRTASATSSTIPDDGLYLFKVIDEKTAAPDEDQLATIKAERVQQLVRRQEGRGHDHPRPPPDASVD